MAVYRTISKTSKQNPYQYFQRVKRIYGIDEIAVGYCKKQRVREQKRALRN